MANADRSAEQFRKMTETPHPEIDPEPGGSHDIEHAHHQHL